MDADVIIIGGGAAGAMAGVHSARFGNRTLIFEPNGKVGKKLRITGKGRCNLTNNCKPDELISNIPRNPKFLYSAFSQYSAEDVMNFFEWSGVPLKTERGNRVFPVSDKASDIVSALENELEAAGAEIIAERVESLMIEDGVCLGVRTSSGEYRSRSALIATGGRSYPSTGSTGDGYRLAQSAGHTVIPPVPSLVPIVCAEKYCADMMGLSLKNVTLSLYDGNKKIYSELGEMLFTHFGVSGPLVLSASSHIGKMQQDRYRLYIDLKPGLTHERLDARLKRDFDENINRIFGNSLSKLLPSKLIPTAVRLSDIEGERRVNQITREERLKFGRLLKAFPLTVKGFRPIEEAIITSGGVCVKEIDPKTMASKLVKGLYFAGEVIDVDGYTGGFNLQIAFSTAYCAAMNM
ncbi:MAG: NAD(P)/FAD-dependent oxidoreductase [Clostridium sp.]|nr:NAD(P)/FAD-dependent oxidoreductase [Clostridium sp.]MCM1548132.1 NAD(P)/FAD-dependent oxidoreductase [Ruminococcus sp.]